MNTRQYAQYNTPSENNPCVVCFTPSVRNNKHYVTYGAVVGSKRVRHQLDMPCSLPVYENTLKQLAERRHNHKSIEVEFCVLEDLHTDISPGDINNALKNVDEKCIRFWEHNLMMFGNCNQNGTTKLKNPESLRNDLNTYMHKIKTNDVIRHRFHKIRQSVNTPNLYEHMFSVVCRFQVSEDNSIIVYGTHIHQGKQRLAITEQDNIWKIVQHKLLHSPQYWFSIPDSVHFNRLCEMDGWS